MYPVLYLIQFLQNKKINKECKERHVLKSIFIRIHIERIPIDKSLNLFYSFRMMMRIMSAMIKFPFLLRKDHSDTKHIAFAFSSAPEMRNYFLQKFLKLENQDSIYQVQQGEYLFKEITFKKIGKILLWFLAWELAWLIAFFKPKHYDGGWTLNVFENGIKSILLSDSGCSFYFFYSYSAVSYLSNYFVSEILGEDASMISSNSAMYRPMRYTYLPHGSLKICSALLEVEYELFSKIGWMQFKNYEKWGLEESIQIDRIKNKEPKVDIAVFSSGEWVRNKFYWRESDLEKIKSYANTHLFIYRIFDEVMLKGVIELKQELGLSVTLFPHPFERAIKKEYGIDPPYLQKIHDAGISYFDEGENSLDNIYYGKIAVAENTTLIPDRWELGLPAYLFSGKGFEKEYHVDFNCDFIGKYRQYCYSDANGLKEKLREALSKF